MIRAVNERIRKFFEQPVNRAIDAAAGLFARLEVLSEDDKIILSLIKAVLPSDSAGMEKALARFRSGLEKKLVSEQKIAGLLDFIRQVAPGTPERALPLLKSYTVERQRETLANLLALALDHGEYRTESLQLITKLAADLGISSEELETMAAEIKSAEAGRSKIIRSGTGIILALIVIGLFILIATWLSSLLFGLVLAYIFLPLEKYFEKRLSTPPGFFSRIFRTIFGWMSLSYIRKKLTRRGDFELSAEEISRRERKMLITKAVTLTVSCVVCGFLVLLVGGSVLLGSYVAELRNNINLLANKNDSVQVVQPDQAQAKLAYDASGKLENASVVAKNVPENKNTTSEVAVSHKSGMWSNMKNWMRRHSWGKNWFASSPEKTAVSEVSRQKRVAEQVSDRLIVVLDNLKQRFQKLPLVQRILTELSEYLAAGKAEQHLTRFFMEKSGGIFNFLAKFAAAFAALLLNILMTFFFFSLLLGKLAEFRNSCDDRKDQPPTDYLVRTVFNGKWLPAMSEENLSEGGRIIAEVFNKLRIWLRGYMTMIAIDFCVYTTVFTLLRVPYAPVLGVIAAMGILLPYIGPISSAVLSVLITLAVGGPAVSVVQIIGIICAYLIHNGIIEQFFIYPAIIGESLGLTTLETIIVVLLGGIIAGIPGLIFALPAASVIKYLVPQIYRCWR